MNWRVLGAVVLVPVFVAMGLTGCASSPAAQGAGSGGAGLGAGATPPAPATFAVARELKDIHFDFDKYNIRPGDAKALQANAKWMRTNPRYLILIEGHADERGTNEYNMALGDRRAKATLNYLLTLGVAANRITIISYGEERPLCAERNEPCWSKNRRAHFMVKGQ